MLTSVNVGLQYRLNHYDQANHAAYDTDNKYFVSVGYTGRWLRSRACSSLRVMEPPSRWVSGILRCRPGVGLGLRLLSHPTAIYGLVALGRLSVQSLAFTVGITPTASSTCWYWVVCMAAWAIAGNRTNLCMEPGRRSGTVQPLVGDRPVCRAATRGFAPASHLWQCRYRSPRAGGPQLQAGPQCGRGWPSCSRPQHLCIGIGRPFALQRNDIDGPLPQVSVATDIALGRWFTAASGVSVGLGYDFITPRTSPTLNVGTLHAD